MTAEDLASWTLKDRARARRLRNRCRATRNSSMCSERFRLWNRLQVEILASGLVTLPKTGDFEQAGLYPPLQCSRSAAGSPRVPVLPTPLHFCKIPSSATLTAWEQHWDLQAWTSAPEAASISSHSWHGKRQGDLKQSCSTRPTRHDTPESTCCFSTPTSSSPISPPACWCIGAGTTTTTWLCFACVTRLVPTSTQFIDSIGRRAAPFSSLARPRWQPISARASRRGVSRNAIWRWFAARPPSQASSTIPSRRRRRRALRASLRSPSSAWPRDRRSIAVRWSRRCR